MDHEHEVILRDPRIAMKMTAAAAERRAHLSKYVKIAVGACVALCLAAVGVSRMRAPSEDNAATPIAIAADATHAAAAPAEPPTTAEQTTPSLEPAAATDPQPAAADTSTAQAQTTDEAPPPEPTVDPDAAKKEKRESQVALERFQLAKAIELGEASVAHDPSDAEAWLILGAAYQAKGDMKNARRVFNACVKEGTGNRRHECAQFAY
jgi:hypothetical protein